MGDYGVATNYQAVGIWGYQHDLKCRVGAPGLGFGGKVKSSSLDGLGLKDPRIND